MFGIVTSARNINGWINSLETLHPEWRRNNNSAFKKKLSCLRFIATNAAELVYSTCNLDALIVDELEEVMPKTKQSLFGIKQFIRQLKKEGKLNCVVLKKSTQKDMVTDEVVVPNEVLRVWLRNHHKCFSLINLTLGKMEKSIIIVHFWCTHNWSEWILNSVYYLDTK